MSTPHQEASLQLALTTASIRAILAGRTYQALERLERPLPASWEEAALPDRPRIGTNALVSSSATDAERWQQAWGFC
jgi:hypothetical protein